MTNMYINTLVEAHKSGQRDFSNISVVFSYSLEGADLSGSKFTHVNFEGKDLSGANLSGSTFESCDFDSARLHGANLAGATFIGCYLGSTDIARANFSNVTVRNARSFSPRNWASANLEGMDMALFPIDSSDRSAIAAVLRREAGDDPAKLACITYLDSNPESHCWDGFVDHFARTSPKELIWGLTVMQKYPSLQSNAEAYLKTLALRDIEGVNLPEGPLSGKLAVGDEVAFTAGRSRETVIQHVIAVKANGAIVIDVPRRGRSTENATFNMNGTEINPATSYLGKIELVTPETREQLEYASLRSKLQNTPYSSLSIEKLRQIVAVVDQG